MGAKEIWAIIGIVFASLGSVFMMERVQGIASWSAQSINPLIGRILLSLGQLIITAYLLHAVFFASPHIFSMFLQFLVALMNGAVLILLLCPLLKNLKKREK